MSIPVYIATGFLDSGKTTFLNNLLNKNESKEINILVAQFTRRFIGKLLFTIFAVFFFAVFMFSMGGI
ncbi:MULTISPECIES: GTP-binding protein [unclassified Sedimentibacter]|uniref:GTP-binding protein n=1 Tax=unclassified Sedimentibacter TaxID=2649220 RepID=UPI0027DFCFA0|nr:GTP-binding protein [Sedimentibacter sp. MB35-C1]WMJ75893.1 GTP-binding protein [Sedimentibacter sp. MB35-C1]